MGLKLPDGTILNGAGDLGDTSYWVTTTGGINYPDGLIGIWRWDPTYTLDVIGNIKCTEELVVGNLDETDVLLTLEGDHGFTDTQFKLISWSENNANQGGLDIDASYGGSHTAIQAWRNNYQPWVYDWSDLALQPHGGNVGIGITNPGYTLNVSGDINVSGDYYISGTPIADFVFDEDYSVASIEEHARLMWENKHLPKVSGENDLGNEPYSMSERREQMLEELEIAHIYIERLNATVTTMQDMIEEMRQEINNLKQ